MGEETSGHSSDLKWSWIIGILLLDIGEVDLLFLPMSCYVGDRCHVTLSGTKIEYAVNVDGVVGPFLPHKTNSGKWSSMPSP